MDEKGTNRMLALLVFVSSSISAFSLGALAYTFAVGELPFGLHSMVQEKSLRDDKVIAAAKVSKVQAPTDNAGSLRVDEDVLASFAAELKAEKEKIALEKIDIEEQRKSVNQIVAQAKAMQDKVEAKEKEVSELLKKVDAKERSNVGDMQKLIMGMELAASVKLLLSLDDTLAARILYTMNKKNAAKIVDSGVNDKNKETVERIKRITAKMQTLSDELKGDIPK